MILKEYIGLDTQNKNRVFVDIECEICGCTFSRQKRKVKTHTCSLRCLSLLKGTSILIFCNHCEKPIERSVSKLTKSKSGQYFCSKECKDIAQTYNKLIQPSHYGTGASEYTYRKKAFRYYPHECQLCGYKENKAALVVHHIDHDRSNDEIDNLIILCANCHAISHWGQ